MVLKLNIISILRGLSFDFNGRIQTHTNSAAQDLSAASNWYEVSKQTDSYVQMFNINFCRISVIKKEKLV